MLPQVANTTATELRLPKNQLDQRAAELLVSAVHLHPRLESLDLGFNSLGPQVRTPDASVCGVLVFFEVVFIE